MNDKYLIDLMVQETIQGDVPSNVIPLSNENTFQLTARYIAKRRCFLIKKNDKNLEVPENWGPFKNRLSQSFTLTSFEDSDDFLSVLELFYDRELTSVQITIEGKESKVFFSQAG